MIVFTNGVFDVLHIGHIRLLQFARSQGTKLVVGINSDESTSELKGLGRPFNNQHNRKETLEAIRFVDEVIIFNELTPLELIKQIDPDIVVKGGDYSISSVIAGERAKVVLAPYYPSHSTTHYANSLGWR